MRFADIPVRPISHRGYVWCLIPGCESNWQFMFNKSDQEVDAFLRERGWRRVVALPTSLGLAWGMVCESPQHEISDEYFQEQA